MIRAFTAAALSIALVASAQAQDGPLRRAGRALDQTGKNIRATVETEIVRGQITAQERDVLTRVGKRIDWDKQLAGSTLRLEAQPGGVVVLQGSVLSEAARARVIDLTENTTGVTSVVDQLGVVKDVKVIEAKPDPRVIEVTPPARVIESRPGAHIIETPSSTTVIEPTAPVGSKVIIKP
ncbi:BON domain-containing protein [Tundrisphaera sp. TA3]|uniref:BON domain-containing protein n=1 Tax=Tundrisphaera sp. TA3 TaxID=3435775 RepID=UPI003EC114C7